MPEISLPIVDAADRQTSPADALVSANVILRGGIFADGARREIAMFMDLCNLIEASILHERLLCLPRSVPARVESIGIIDALTNEGFLWKLELADDELVTKAAVSVLDYLPGLSVAGAKKLLVSITGRHAPECDPRPVADAFLRMRIQETCQAARSAVFPVRCPAPLC